MKTEHLLIMRFTALGEVAMLVPVVSSLAQQYPELRITVLSNPFARSLFDGIAHNVGFMAADLNGEYHGVKGLNALYRRLVAKNFTAIADMQSILRSSYLRMRFNIDRYHVEHIDKHRRERRQLVATTGKQMVQLPSVFELYADVLARLGYPVDMDFTSVFPPTGGNMRLISDLVGEKKPFQQWIGVAPFAAYQGKAYPLPLMENVIDELTRRHPSCRIFLFGNNSDKERLALDKLAEGRKNCINASALLGGIYKELILMSHLDVMLSMDSANMHLASIAGTPVVSIWGATHPLAGYMGWHQRPDDVVQTDMPCRPCSISGNRPCLRGDYACLTSIKPVSVADSVDRVLMR